MLKLLAPFIALGFLTCSSLSAQPDTDKKLDALEKNLSAEQKRLLHEYFDFAVRSEVSSFDPARGVPLRAVPDILGELIDQIAAMPPERSKVFWRDLPNFLRLGFRRLDPLHVSAEERKAAERLPAAAKEQVAKLLSDQLDETLAARRMILGHGPACRAMVVDQLRKLAVKSPKRMLHEDLLANLEFEEAHERRLRIIEPVLQKASKLDKSRKKANSTIAVLIARGICDVRKHPAEDPYGSLCYFNFLRNNHDYSGGAGLQFCNGDGNRLDVNFYGGQDNRLISLGEVNFAEVKKAPGAETTAKWWKDGNSGPPIVAVVGHVYLLHLVDPRDKIDFAVKFRVLELSADEWIIIEWERIPQEK